MLKFLQVLIMNTINNDQVNWLLFTSVVVNENSDKELVIFSHRANMINSSWGLVSFFFADCLNHFISLEELADSELYICPNCKKRQRSTKKFWLKRLPNVRQLNLCIIVFAACNLASDSVNLPALLLLPLENQL